MKELKKSPGINPGNYLKTNGYKFQETSIDPKKLKANPNNPYKPLDPDTYSRLKKDISVRGIIDPLIIDENLTLLTGHNRLRIALELGLKEVPVRKVSELSEKEKSKIMILDNLLRRQLSPEERVDFIRTVYKDEIEKDHRGGNQKAKGTSGTFDKSIIISRDLGISQRQAKRDLKKAKGTSGTFEPKKPTSNIPKLKAEIKKIKEKIKSLESDLAKKTKELNKIESQQKG